MDNTTWVLLLILLGSLFVVATCISVRMEINKKTQEAIIGSYKEDCDYLIGEIISRFMKIGEIQLEKNPNVINLEERSQEKITFAQSYSEENVRLSSEYEALLFILKHNLPEVIYEKVKSIDNVIKQATSHEVACTGNLKLRSVKIKNMLEELNNKLEELDKIIAGL
jgi:glycine betaine/choline ABC-type transport system substrate-binding protein